MLDLLALGLGHVVLVAFSLLLLSDAPLRRGGRLHWPGPEELRPLLPACAVFLGVIAVHFAEVRLDAWATGSLGLDLTPQVYGLEGDTVAALQAGQLPVAVQGLLLLVYLYGYPFLIYFTPLFLLLHRDREGLALFALGFAALYAMTLPFYLFLPVDDPWLASQQPWYHGRPIAFMLQQAWPAIVPAYWQFTTPNNVLPSLHAGISALCALVAWRSGHRRFAALAAFFAVLIPPASFYVGVHWLVDPLLAYAMVGVAYALAWRARPSFLARAQPRAAPKPHLVAGPVEVAGAEAAVLPRKNP